MLEPNQLWDEWVLQARLKYLAFTRMMWLCEMMLLLMWFLGLAMFGVGLPMFSLIIGFQSLRVVTELINHFELARRFNVQDRYHLFPFF